MVALGAALSLPVVAQTVKVTPLGEIDIILVSHMHGDHAGNAHNKASNSGSGKVRAGSKTEAFVKVSKVLVIVPLSGKTIAFDATGKCTAGC